MPQQPPPSGVDAAAVTREGHRSYEPPAILAKKQLRSEKLLLLVARLLFLVLLVTVTVLTIASAKGELPEEFDLTTVAGLFLASMAVGVIVLVVDAMTPNKRLTSVVGVYLGICVGLIGALAIGALIDVVAEAWDIKQPGQPPTRMEIYLGLGKVIIAIVLCYLAVSVVLTTKDDFRLVIPYVEFAKQVRGVRPLLVDSSVLIDGRIEALARTGFLVAPLVVPQFVVDELQMLADSSDKLKRGRGRRGLTMVSNLQEIPAIDLSIDTTEVEGRSVDHMLLQMAGDQKMRILTTDYNLNKVAQIKGVGVLNLNELANAIKPQVIPGEPLTIEIVKRGESAQQGVGYLADGTMVVVEEAADRIGAEVALIVTNSLQTSAGRMIFGRLAEGAPDQRASFTHRMADAATDQPHTATRPTQDR
ncbi:MAG: PIN/TRAM domain-containing protein [Planctomycetota bacterium]|nr:PIN/TRAM domain-containing protein [Planctomycetota bacterium]MCZ6494462.1 PIN/TRAM domain-containing protein [Planctomycetota bacterium]MCZ6543437.1 PIN/TRAM domain-containing protein [Planctomycetota bacterium]MCZ6612380.1 PIN/TRAM domain-containing protein [Planctomycetota bacterium]MCZ6810796.1 PIN/TRAM domain-containing protein [Planctomycetota bacterium]